MAKAAWIQPNFSGGEWSPLAYGRVDSDAYKTGLATCENYVPTIQGGLTRRPGTAYIAATKDNTTVRLIPFEFSLTQTYILEFGNQYVRFYTNNGQLISGSSAYEVATPYTLADIWSLSFVQSADTLYLAHPKYFPRKLQRNGATNWSLVLLNNGLTAITNGGEHSYDGPYLNQNTDTTKTLTIGAGNNAACTIGTGYALTESSGAGILATLTDGQCLRLYTTDGTAGLSTSQAYWSWGVVRVTAGAYTLICRSPMFQSPTYQIRKGAWSSGVNVNVSTPTARNYPSVVTFHQDRLVFAGGFSYPNRFDTSNAGDYETFTPTVLDSTGHVIDSNAISATLNSQKVNAITWLVSDMTGLLAGTANAEWVIAASTAQEALTPTNVNAKVVSTYGSTSVPPVRSGNNTLFVQRAGRKVRQFTYEFTMGGAMFKAVDISAIAEHLTETGIKQMALAQAPHPIVWMVTNDARLIAMSYDKDTGLLAWHKHPLGGTNVQVISIASIPSPDGTWDDLWLVVKRDGTGQTVERLSKFWEDGDTLVGTTVDNCVLFADCGWFYSGVSTSVVTGLTWLANQTVTVLVDGKVHPDTQVDSSGNLTLVFAGSIIKVGLRYTSTGRTLRIEAGAADGTAQGKYKRIHRAIFRFFQTVGTTVQPTNGTAYPEPWRSSADNMDQTTALFTGDKRWSWEGSYEIEGQIAWSQSDPLPSNILMISAQLETQDGG